MCLKHTTFKGNYTKITGRELAIHYMSGSVEGALSS